MLRPETRKWLIRIAAGVHLTIAALFSTHVLVEYALPSILEPLLRTYGNYSGTYTHFNFFAPSVSTQFRTHFRVGAADGTVKSVDITTPSAEANLRIATMFNAFQIEPARPQLMRSWAAYLLAKYPEAEWVEAKVEELNIPSLAELKAGKASDWIEVERKAFVRRTPSER
ncbi:MAG TPA: hypothetical protein VN878_01440 [Usitatibacter sp.]|nr:hypothetical protein [Usitatibacter sp.]